MKFNELEVDSKKSRKRSGRGISAGRGKTAGRGTKGQNSRSGGKRRPGFEGGQNPLYMRLPKLRGFNSHLKGYQQVTTEQLAQVKGSTIDHASLKEASLINNMYRPVKVILKGEVNKKFTVNVDKITPGAEKAVKKAGGSFKQTVSPDRPKKTKKPNKKS